MQGASDHEIVLNLWYLRDEEGIVYSLRARAYVCQGTHDQKLSFLKERAQYDYLVADSFVIPERFHLRIGESARILLKAEKIHFPINPL